MRISDWSSDVCSSYLYGTFVFVQTIRHRDYFLPPGEGDLQADAHASPPSGHRAVVSLGLLFLALLPMLWFALHFRHLLLPGLLFFCALIQANVAVLPWSVSLPDRKRVV